MAHSAGAFWIESVEAVVLMTVAYLNCSLSGRDLPGAKFKWFSHFYFIFFFSGGGARRCSGLHQLVGLTVVAHQ